MRRRTASRSCNISYSSFCRRSQLPHCVFLPALAAATAGAAAAAAAAEEEEEEMTPAGGVSSGCCTAMLPRLSLLCVRSAASARPTEVCKDGAEDGATAAVRLRLGLADLAADGGRFLVQRSGVDFVLLCAAATIGPSSSDVVAVLSTSLQALPFAAGIRAATAAAAAVPCLPHRAVPRGQERSCRRPPA